MPSDQACPSFRLVDKASLQATRNLNQSLLIMNGNATIPGDWAGCVSGYKMRGAVWFRMSMVGGISSGLRTRQACTKIRGIVGMLQTSNNFPQYCLDTQISLCSASAIENEAFV